MLELVRHTVFIRTVLVQTVLVQEMLCETDRDRAPLGHLVRDLPANPLAPIRIRRRHPKMLSDSARATLGL
jgi:hypothetical protein